MFCLLHQVLPDSLPEKDEGWKWITYMFCALLFTLFATFHSFQYITNHGMSCKHFGKCSDGG